MNNHVGVKSLIAYYIKLNDQDRSTNLNISGHNVKIKKKITII